MSNHTKVAVNTNVSILSKKFKTRAEKQAKREKHNLNAQHRAGLQAQKASGGGDKNSIQNKIDAISKGQLL
jgi:hypothetical protein